MLTVTKESLVGLIKEQMENAIDSSSKEQVSNRDKQQLSALVYLNNKKEKKIYHLTETLRNLAMGKPIEACQFKDIKHTKDMIQQEDLATVQLNRMKNNVVDSINNLKSRINHTEYLFNAVKQISPGLQHAKVKSQMDLCGTIARRENIKKSFKDRQHKRRENLRLKKDAKKKLQIFIESSVQKYAQTILDTLQEKQNQKNMKKNIINLTRSYDHLKTKQKSEQVKQYRKLISILSSHAQKSSFSDIISYSNHLMYTSTHLEIRLLELTESQKKLQEELDHLSKEYGSFCTKIPVSSQNSQVLVNGNLEKRCFALEKLISLISNPMNALKSKAENLMKVQETQNKSGDNNSGKSRTILSPYIIHKLKTKLRTSLMQNSILDSAPFTVQEAEKLHRGFYGESLQIKKFLEQVQSVLLLKVYFNKSNLQEYLATTENLERESGDLFEYYSFTHNTIRDDLRELFQKLEDTLFQMNLEDLSHTQFMTFSPSLPKINRTNRYKFILERKKSSANAHLEKNTKKRKNHMSNSVLQDIRKIRASINKFSK